MLVLTRKVGQRLVIGDNITVVVSRISGNRVSLGVEAPSDVHIVRAELKQIRDEFQERENVTGDVGAVGPGLPAPVGGSDTFSAQAPR